MTTYPMPADLFGLDDDQKYRNEARAQKAGLEPCTHCGRGVKQGFVTVVVGGGASVKHPDTVTLEDEADPGFMGAWVLGSTCAKSIPIAARAPWTGWN